MFHTVNHITNSPDLAIAQQRLYENRISLMHSDLLKACTPEQLEKAEAIAEKFRESLVFKYISADNSIVNVVVWKSHNMACETKISFELNGKQISISIPAERIVRAGPTRNVVGEIKSAILQAVAKELTEYVYVEVIETSIPKPKENK